MNSNLDSRAQDEQPISLRELLSPISRFWPRLIGAMILSGLICYAASYLIAPSFTSTTTFLPPQQQQSGAAAALANLGALANLAGGAGAGLKSSADQFISLMQSVTVSDRMIDKFGLLQAYDVKFRQDARKELAKYSLFVLGKKDGIISVSVEDPNPVKAAAMANQYVEELRRLTSTLAISEAQQRRVFFEHQMQETKNRLVAAQTVLQDSGVDLGTLRAEPKSAAENYARLRAQLTASEIRLQTLRSTLADGSAEVRQLTSTIDALRAQLADEERSAALPNSPSSSDYISKYREFKYQETLFDLMARQFELARVDESHEGALIQVVDPALPAERKSKPRRGLFGIGGVLAAAVLTIVWLTARALHRSNLRTERPSHASPDKS